MLSLGASYGSLISRILTFFPYIHYTVYPRHATATYGIILNNPATP